MAVFSARRIRSQACLILLALFLAVQPLGQLNISSRCADASGGSLVALAASLCALGPSLQSAISSSWHPTHLFGPAKQFFVTRGRLIAALGKDANCSLGTQPAAYIARSWYVRCGRSPPSLFS
jgi:hypothetical protein